MNCPTQSLNRVRRWVFQDRKRLAELRKIPSKKLTPKQVTEMLRLTGATQQRLATVSQELGDVFTKDVIRSQVKLLRVVAAKAQKAKIKKRPPPL